MLYDVNTKQRHKLRDTNVKFASLKDCFMLQKIRDTGHDMEVDFGEIQCWSYRCCPT